MTDMSNRTYRNMFAEIGISQEEIDRKLESLSKPEASPADAEKGE